MPVNTILTSGYVLNSRYRIVKLLGQGGFGAVYRAWDLNLSSPRALKENFDTSPEAIRQFTQEAMILANLRHPNLPIVVDHFSLPGQGQYLVMEFVEGQDLQTKLQQSEGPVPVPEVLFWVLQVCDALIYMHSQEHPIIHRDIKPSNIIITSQGQAKLVDFGIAKVYERQRKTSTGARAVSPGYSPLEQYGSGATDVRTDIYALGATLYTALTGVTPIESPERQSGQALTPPSSLNPAISPHIENAILKSMAMSPEQRFQSVNELKSALSGDGHGASTQRPGAWMEFIRKNRSIIIAGMILLACLLCLPFGYWLVNQLPAAIGASQTQRAVSQEQTRIALNQLHDQTSTPTLMPPETIPTSADLSAKITPPTPTLRPTRPTSTARARTLTPTATESIWQPCPDVYESRLHVGDHAYVSYDPPLRNRVRARPSTNAAIRGHIAPGEEVEILDGPECANHWIWWYVKKAGSDLTGWTAEGDQENYWLVPLP